MRPEKDWLDRLFVLHALLGSSAEGERVNAWRLLDKLLKHHGKTWNDIPGLLAAVQERRSAPSQAPSPPPPTGDPLTGGELFERIQAVFQDFLSLEPDEYVVITLWAMARTSLAGSCTRRDWCCGAACVVVAKQLASTFSTASSPVRKSPIT